MNKCNHLNISNEMCVHCEQIVKKDIFDTLQRENAEMSKVITEYVDLCDEREVIGGRNFFIGIYNKINKKVTK